MRFVSTFEGIIRDRSEERNRGGGQNRFHQRHAGDTQSKRRFAFLNQLIDGLCERSRRSNRDMALEMHGHLPWIILRVLPPTTDSFTPLHFYLSGAYGRRAQNRIRPWGIWARHSLPSIQSRSSRDSCTDLQTAILRNRHGPQTRNSRLNNHARTKPGTRPITRASCTSPKTWGGWHISVK